MEFTRRQALASAAALVSTGAAPPPLRPADSLNSAAERSGRRFGSAVAWSPPGADRGSFANSPYAHILERECALLVPENELKWQWSRPAPDRFNFAQFDGIADYATTHGFKLRGHTLFWTPEKWYPKWLAQMHFGSAAEVERLLTDHVRTVCRRYGTRIYSYDVVNEAVQPETGEIRSTNVTRAFGGEAFLDLMYHTARAQAPHAQLVYNDYMSWERTREDESHMNGVLRLLEGFRRRGTPVDALGVQSHIRLLKRASVGEIVRESERPWRRFLDEVTGMGYQLLITEFDVNDRMAPTDIAARDRMVADYGKAYLELMLSYPQLRDILCWGMVDRYSWLSGFDPRRDGTTKRGTPYDVNFRPKPLRQAIAAAFANARSPRALALCAALLLTSCATPQQPSAQPEIAVTVDDLPLHGPLPAGETPVTVARGVIAALKAQHVPAYGFVNGHWVADRPDTKQVLDMWRAAGLALGNHGWSHRHLSEMTAAEFEQELVRNEPLLRMSSKDWHWFRYPFLDEGWKSPKRAAGREILAGHRYKVADVTMDFGDWMWTAPYARCSNAGDKAAVAKLEQLYMQAARESIGYFRNVSHTVYGRDIPYVLLLHISPFEARVLPRLLALYREQGFRFVSLPAAESDPVYAQDMNPRLPADPKDMEGKAASKSALPARTDFAPVLDKICT